MHYPQACYGNRWYFGTISKTGRKTVTVAFDEGNFFQSFNIDYVIRSLL